VGADWLLGVLACAAVGGYAALTSIHAGDSRGWNAFADIGELLAAALATFACALRVRRERQVRAGTSVLREATGGESSASAQRHGQLGWSLLGAGIAAWTVAQLITCIYEIGLERQLPEPSLADGAFLIGYLLIVAGLLAFVRTPAGLLSHLRGAVEALFITCGFVLCSWSLVVGSFVTDLAHLSLAGAVNLSYPLLDAVALSAVFFVALYRRADPLIGLGLLSIGICLSAVSDSAWWYITQVNAHPPLVTPLEAGWVASYLAIAIAALRAGEARPRRESASVRRSALILPSLPAAGGVLILTAEWLTHGHVQSPGLLLGILMASVLLGVALLMIVSYENHALTGYLERRVEQRTTELRRTERYYRALVHNSSDIVMVIDSSMRIRYVSDSSASLFGSARDGLLGRTLEVFGERAAAALAEGVARTVRDAGHVARVEWELTDAAGEARCAESAISNLLGDPHVSGFVLNTRDDTDRAALASQLRDQAFHDPLTGLANRALLGDRASQALARAARGASLVGVLVIDLDAFKLVNDGFGHAAGDELLRAIAERLQSTVRPEDTVARFGGDEFVVLMDACQETADALELAERLRDAVHQTLEIDDVEHRVSASIGVAVGGPPETNFEQLLCDADVALYAVKRAGRNAVELFKSSMHQNARERFNLQSELRSAIEEGELRLHYQPEFSAAGGQLEGFEALVRWQHPRHGLLAPDAFIPLSEETGLVVPLGRWVLREAFKQAAAWTSAHGRGRQLLIAVNVSAVQLKAPTLIDDVREALQSSGVDPRRVVLELTESSFIDATAEIIDTLRSLKALGVSLAIDDFGTGYASVSMLQAMPIDILKIDRSFVDSIDDGARGNELLEAIVNIGHALSLVTIAEGVELSSQLRTVRELGCDLVQGYLLGRPLPVDEANEVIAEHAGRSPRLIARRAGAKAGQLMP